MVTKQIRYCVKVNEEINLSGLTIPALLTKIEKDIKFWEDCLRGNKDKKFVKNINILIKEYKNAFKTVFNYKEN